MSGDIWIGIAALAELKVATHQSTQRWAIKHAEVRYVPGKGRGGKVMEVSLSSLPPEMQAAYYSRLGGAGGAPESAIEPVAEVPVIRKGEVVPIPTERLPRLALAVGNPTRGSSALTPGQESLALKRADLAHYIERRMSVAKANGGSRTKTLDAAVALYNQGLLMPELRSELGGLTAPTVRRWLKELKARGGDYRALAPRWGDRARGATTLTPWEQDAVLRVALQPNRPSLGSAIVVARHLLRHEGIATQASDSAFRRYLQWFRDNYNHVWNMERMSEKYLDERNLPYVMRDSNSLEVGEILVADGHTLNFTVINPATGKPARATLVMYFDWRSRFPAGFEIMLTENVLSIHSALRNAILTMGKIPQCVLLDNGKGFKAKLFTGSAPVDLEQCYCSGLYGRLGITVRFARPYNAKDKVIERFFGTFDSYVEKLFPSYVGGSIGDKPAYMMRNEEYHKRRHNPYVPTIDEAMAMVVELLTRFYVRLPHEGLGGRTPLEVFEAGKGPGVDEGELAHLMLASEPRAVANSSVVLHGIRYGADALAALRGRVLVKYDLHDLASVLVFGEDGRYICKAERWEVVDPLLRGVTDMDTVRRVKTSQARIKGEAKRLARDIHARRITEGGPLEANVIKGAARAAIEAAEAEIVGAEAPERPPVPEIGYAAPVRISPPAKPIFDDGWKRYDHLMKIGDAAWDDADRTWVEEYKAGRIFPGQYAKFYAARKAAI